MRKNPILVGCIMGLLLAGTASAARTQVYFHFARANMDHDEFLYDGMGCAGNALTTYWDHRFETARYQGPRQCTVTDTSVFLRCMLAKGYGLAPNGYRTSRAWNAKTPSRGCD